MSVSIHQPLWYAFWYLQAFDYWNFVQEEHGVELAINPMQCRLRNLNYSGAIKVDIEYTRANERVTHKDVVIGRIPIMLHSNKLQILVFQLIFRLHRRCVLHKKTPAEIAKLGECPIDAGPIFAFVCLSWNDTPFRRVLCCERCRTSCPHSGTIVQEPHYCRDG